MARNLFVTVFMARSGSKFLRSLLNQHPDINDFGEIFHNRELAFKEEFSILDKFAEVLLCPNPVSGFQFRYPRHFREFPEILQLIEKNNATIKVILLKRRNKLKGAISQQNSERLKAKTGKAHLYQSSEQQDLTKLSLDVKRALKEALDRERLDDQYLTWARKLFEIHEIYYEDLCTDQERVVAETCRFLSVQPFKPGTMAASELVKITSENLEDAIANYQELDTVVRAASRGYWLDNSSVETIRPGTRALIEKRIDTRSGKTFKLIADTFKLKTNTIFLEHVVEDHSGKDQLISIQEKNVLWSPDGGATWSVHPVGEAFRKCFTTRAGTHLLQKETGTVYRCGPDWKLRHVVETGPYPWHGSWSIDQNNDTGTIIWCEYPYSASKLNVWRSVDDGETWMPCFTQSGHPTDPKAGSIRHFHLVQKCTTHPNRWYLSSGDTEEQSKFWVSDDDGASWQQVPINEVLGWPENLPDRLVPKLHRFTAMIQTDEKLLWATDDTFDRTGARVCIVEKNKLDTIKIISETCGNNEMRNLIQLDDQYALAISESKLDLQCVSITLIDVAHASIDGTVALENKLGLKSNFMNGVSSKSAAQNIFYSQSDNKILRPSPMITRWKLELN